jgi:hypothetical protein
VVIEVLEAILDLRSYRRCAILQGYKDKRIVIFILIIVWNVMLAPTSVGLAIVV